MSMLIYYEKEIKCAIGNIPLPGPVVQSVASPTADPGIASMIPGRSHTNMETDHEIIRSFFTFTRFKKGCCQLQAK